MSSSKINLRVCAAWCVLSLLASSASPWLSARALAQEGQGLMKMGESDMSDERARAHFKVGTSLYEAGRFKEAANEWEQAYALSKREGLLYNIYVAHRDASDLPHAIDALERFLATSAPDPKQRINLQARLTAMKNAQAGAPQQPVAAPVDQTQAAPPAPAAQPAAEPAPAPPPSAAAPSSAPAQSSSSSVLPLVFIISGAALLGGSLAVGLVTQGKVSKIEKACPNNACPASFDLGKQRSDARSLATVTDLLLVGGAVVTGAGLVLWLTGGSKSSEHERAQALGTTHAQTASWTPAWTPALACATTGCVGSVSGSF